MSKGPNVVMEGNWIWRKVIWAADCKECDCCGEPVCPICDVHYAECDCPGPTQDEVEYKTINGIEYGRMLYDQG